MKRKVLLIFICLMALLSSTVLAAPVPLTAGVAPGTKLIVITNGVRLRDVNNPDTSIIATLTANEVVTLVSYGTPYTRVISSNNTEGMVSPDFLAIQSGSASPSVTPKPSPTLSVTATPMGSSPTIQTQPSVIPTLVVSAAPSTTPTPMERLNSVPPWIYAEILVSVIILIIIAARKRK